jgi:hypothetical protein
MRTERLSGGVVRLRAIGATVRVEVTGSAAADALAEVERVWHLCTVPGTAPEGYAAPGVHGPPAEATVVLVHDADGPAEVVASPGRVEGSVLPDAMQALTQAVTRAAIDAQQGRVVMLHAAGLQSRTTGDTVALVGPGGTGKTTLVRTLGPGRAYVTDETVAVRFDRTVLPYPKPLSVRRQPGSLWKDETDPTSMGLAGPGGGGRLVAIGLLERSDDHDGPPVVEAVGTLDAIAALTPETSHLPELERPLQRMAALCDAVEVVRVAYREAADLAPLVDGWIGAPVPAGARG